MVVLGFDTSTPVTAVGLRLADGTTLQAHDHPAPSERPGHATRLLPLAEQLLAQAGLSWDALGRIAVGVGPGTFTGLRVGIATAHGLAGALGVELVPVGSLRALAERPLNEGWEGSVLAAIDARRGEAFVGAWSAAGSIFAARAVAPQDFAQALGGAHDRASASEDGSWLAVGDGAVRYRSSLEDLGVQIPPDSSPKHSISGACICALGLQADARTTESVLPDYLRRPDAELALQGAGG